METLPLDSATNLQVLLNPYYEKWRSQFMMCRKRQMLQNNAKKLQLEIVYMLAANFAAQPLPLFQCLGGHNINNSDLSIEQQYSIFSKTVVAGNRKHYYSNGQPEYCATELCEFVEYSQPYVNVNRITRSILKVGQNTKISTNNMYSQIHQQMFTLKYFNLLTELNFLIKI
ncbi:unnamed protein product (macronuclear) [Paramecium tetraurelia]|uniref:DDE Tnp4 domain-containing protein n=1 Tax=Paramecium tetraurelia TaxID=5888 RepID=A0BTQ6_PARTE|nr:uncharacterized protein GSPATT00032155001 [Paramecium tetraurelia]CAK61923.1 unnamed protein product [Paramecium tetraurelia]|eukprot:XP_001429321.1 hypothetical protein (macronuclear) [Paramecium tetraurelia strain d4-2]